jgi:cell division transport system permease protein
MDMVAQRRIVPQEELDRLIEPWLGNAGDAETVPVPALIDVRLGGKATPQAIEALADALAGTAPDARIDAQSSWLQPVFSALRSLQYLALALVLLLAVTSAAAVFLAARSALGNNRATIEIVHLLGGTDGQIAQLFQRAVLVDSILGGVAGLVLGLAAVLALGYQFAALDSGMIASAGLDWIDWIVIALIPVFGVLLAVATARFTVLAAVRKML